MNLKKKNCFTFSEILLYEHISFGFCRRMTTWQNGVHYQPLKDLIKKPEILIWSA